MNAHAPIPLETPEVRRERVLERQLAMLGRLAEIGMTIAEAVGRQVEAACEGEEPADPAVLKTCSVTYNRAARAVRLSLALQSKLLKDPPIRRDDADDKPDDPESWTLSHAVQVRRVVGVVRRVAEAEGLDRETVDFLETEAEERLGDRAYGDIAKRPLGQIVARLCEELDLNPNWQALLTEPWAQDEMRQGPKGSPFTALRSRIEAEAIPPPLKESS